MKGLLYICQMALPQAFLESLTGVAGFNRSSFEAVHISGEQVTSIRVNPEKNRSLDTAGREQVPWCPYGYYLPERPSFTLDPLLHAGAYYVQEASSMFIWYVLQQLIGVNTEKKVLDLCAAPGGKSSLLASYFTNGWVVANEVIKQRAAVLVENMTKWGSDHVVVTNNDPVHFQSLPGYFEVMMVDAPCSGSGMFRKDPAAMEEWSGQAVQLCSQRQQRILADVLPALAEEGVLIYSTCSYSPEEDEAIADWLVAEMGMENLSLSVPAGWGIVETLSPQNKASGYRFYPDHIKGEGFFIAVFRKKSPGSDSHRLKELALPVPSRQELLQVQSFLQIPATYSLFKQGDQIRAVPARWYKDLQVLAKALYIKKAGVGIGTIKGKDVIPEHELAMSHLWEGHFTPIPLTKEQALVYLRRKDLLLPDAPKGWHLVAYEDLPLGWVKVLPNRLNNYYPAEWRILKE